MTKAGRRFDLGSGPGYSRFVRVAKVALPAMAMVVIALVVVWPQLRQGLENSFSLEFAEISGGLMPTQRLVNARYQGFDSEDQPFSVTADLAEETEPGSRIVRLDNPKADVAFKDGTWAMVQAAQGIYDQATAVLTLEGGVDLFQDTGYELHTPAATIDVKSGTAFGTDPVNGQGPLGSMNAEGFTIDRQAGVVQLTGKARLVIRPDALEGETAR